MNVLMIAPGYPGEMPYFCRGLARNGARVYGLSDVPEQELPALARENLSGYLRVPNLTDEDAVVRAVAAGVGGHTVARVVCLWEPGVVLAAKLREALSVPGMRVAQAPRRDARCEIVAALVREYGGERVEERDRVWGLRLRAGGGEREPDDCERGSVKGSAPVISSAARVLPSLMVRNLILEMAGRSMTLITRISPWRVSCTSRTWIGKLPAAPATIASRRSSSSRS